MDTAGSYELEKAGTTKIRAVAKIWSSTKTDNIGASDTGFVDKPQGEDFQRVSLSFGRQSPRYLLDFCYEQHHDNSIVFKREVKPLIHGVFDGYNATTIVTGANDFDKSCLLKGLSEDNGLLLLTATEMIELAKKNEKVVSISMFEATSDSVSDILGKTNQVVTGDSAKKIPFRGLLTATLSTTLEFQNLLDLGLCKFKQKSDPFRKSHVGFIFHVSTPGGQLIGKLSFVDLAGYQNFRTQNIPASALMMNLKINKSIHAVHNVLYALNAHETHVPYRETKLTHLLQDSLGRTSRILLVTCLNQSVSQDAIYMISLASRSCQSPIKATSSSVKKPKTLSRPIMDKFASPLVREVSNNFRKLGKKDNCYSSALKTRRLFVEKKIKGTKLVSTQSGLSNNQALEISRNQEPSSQVSRLDISPAPENVCKQELSSQLSLLSIGPSPENAFEQKDILPLTTVKPEEFNTLEKDIDTCEEHVTKPLLMNDAGKENNGMVTPSCSRKHETSEIVCYQSPWQAFSESSARTKGSLVQDYLLFLNTANKDELTRLKGIGDKRAAYIVDLRNESAQPFKELDDLKSIGLSSKQINRMIKDQVGGLF